MVGFVSEIILYLFGVVVEKIDCFVYFGNGVIEGFFGFMY